MRRTALLLLGLVIVGAVLTVALSDTMAARFNPVPPNASFDSEWQQLDDLNAALIRGIFEQIKQRPAPAPTAKGELVLPEPPLPEVRVNGMSSEDLASAKAALRIREDRAEQTRHDAIYARHRCADLITTGAFIAFCFALAGTVSILVAPTARRWHARWTSRRRMRPSVSGVHIAEKAGVWWGLLESASAPFRDAFGRGRRQSRGKDVDVS
jgi:hypothetical protein